MAEKICNGTSPTARSCNSKRATPQPVRVVEISNPIMIETSASEFRAIVQSLTGRKRISASGSQYQEMNLYSDNLYSPQVKVAKLEDGLQTLKDRKTSVSAVTDHDNANMTNSCSDKDHADARIFRGLEVQPIQIPEYFLSQYHEFGSMERIGDTRDIVFDIFAPSIMFSQFEYL